MEDMLDTMQNTYRPMIAMFASIAEDKRDEARTIIKNEMNKFNRATDGTLALQIDYLQTIAVRA